MSGVRCLNYSVCSAVFKIISYCNSLIFFLSIVLHCLYVTSSPLYCANSEYAVYLQSAVANLPELILFSQSVCPEPCTDQDHTDSLFSLQSL